MEEKKIEWAMPALVELGNAGYTFGTPCGPGNNIGDDDCLAGGIALGACTSGDTVTATCSYGGNF
jgi:hypothetical protein